MGVAARAGDAPVREAIARTATGSASASPTWLPPCTPTVVLGGSVAALDDLLLDPVRETVKERVRMFPVQDFCIERSLLEDKAGLLGGMRWPPLGHTNRAGRPGF